MRCARANPVADEELSRPVIVDIWINSFNRVEQGKALCAEIRMSHGGRFVGGSRAEVLEDIRRYNCLRRLIRKVSLQAHVVLRAQTLITAGRDVALYGFTSLVPRRALG